MNREPTALRLALVALAIACFGIAAIELATRTEVRGPLIFVSAGLALLALSFV